MADRDLYDVLGLSRGVSDDEIKKAYRTLARRYHPDANPDDPAAAEQFKEVQHAYETLRDPERRRRYDVFGDDGARAGAGAGAGGFSGAGDFGGLNDLFDAFFGGDAFGGAGRSGGNSGRRAAPTPRSSIELTLRDIVFGVRKTVEPRMPVECDTCAGSGAAPGTHPERCSTCEGRGEVRQVRRCCSVSSSRPCRARRAPEPVRYCRTRARPAAAMGACTGRAASTSTCRRASTTASGSASRSVARPRPAVVRRATST